MSGSKRGPGDRHGRNIPNDDPNLKPHGQPSEMYPKYNVPKASPLTEQELREIENHKDLRDAIHKTKLYSNPKRRKDRNRRAYNQQQINDDYEEENAATRNPFTTTETWSSRFEKPERSLPDISGLKNVRHMFPPELRKRIESECGISSDSIRDPREHKDSESGPGKSKDLGEHPAVAVVTQFERTQGDQENVAGDLDVGDDDSPVEDETFEDDADGDYNAEGAFDNGEDDDQGSNGGQGGDDGVVD